MVSEFGKVMREIRASTGDSLRDLAVKLEVSAAFLSAMEVGKKKIPLEYVDKICDIYNLDYATKLKLEDAANVTNHKVVLDLSGLDKEQTEASLAFARKIKTADPELVKKLLDALAEIDE